MRNLATLFLLAPLAHAQPVDFNRQVRPVLESACLACHGAVGPAAGGIRVVSAESIRGSLVPGRPDESKLYTTLELPAGKPGSMPPGAQLPADKRELIRRWIAEGAAWPAGLTLGTPAAKLADDMALVEKLRERILANAGHTPPGKPYSTRIPGTGVSFDMVPIPGGTFTMGTPTEGPPHRVTVDPFWMGKYEITWDQYRLFMFAQQAGEQVLGDSLVDAVSRPTRPYVEMSFGMGIDGYPAISMTQHAANKFAEWLSARTGQFYRLPTEAEWEYACRAGADEDAPAEPADYGWFAANSGGRYRKVGTKKPNAWGLFDMLGNVMEWTLDEYAPYTAAPAVNPWRPPATPYPQAVRGGSWNDKAGRLRCGARVASDPSWKMQDPQLPKSIWYLTDAQWLGFRLVRPVKLPTAAGMYKYWNNGVETE